MYEWVFLKRICADGIYSLILWAIIKEMKPFYGAFIVRMISRVHQDEILYLSLENVLHDGIYTIHYSFARFTWKKEGKGNPFWNHITCCQILHLFMSNKMRYTNHSYILIQNVFHNIDIDFDTYTHIFVAVHHRKKKTMKEKWNL